MKMTKKKYVEFYSALTGHSKSFVEKNLHERYGIKEPRYSFIAGKQSYTAWILKNHIYCQYFIENSCQGAWYFDFDNYEFNWKLVEEDQEEEKAQIIADSVILND
jgi:hypothetical protein